MRIRSIVLGIYFTLCNVLKIYERKDVIVERVVPVEKVESVLGV